MMHKHQLLISVIWWACSLVNWFWLMGYHNCQYRKNGHYEKNLVWIIIASMFSGVSGFIVSAIAFKAKYWAWRPLSKNERDQIQMLAMLESADDQHGDSAFNQAQGQTMSTMSMTAITKKLKAKTRRKGIKITV